jgi:hypothetical protein
MPGAYYCIPLMLLDNCHQNYERNEPKQPAEIKARGGVVAQQSHRPLVSEKTRLGGRNGLWA